MPEPALSYTRVHRADRPTVVLLHGFLGDKEDWLDFLKRPGDSFDTIAIDLPGHGSSTEVPERYFNFDECSDAIAGVLTSIGVARYCLIGYSMGGRIALYHALRHEDKIRSLVMISANPGIKSEDERRERYEADLRLATDLESRGLDSFIDRWYSQPLFDSLKMHPGFERTKTRRLDGSAEALSRALRAFSVGAQPPLWDQLADLTIPVLCVAGERDQQYVELATRTADLCRRGKLCIISGAGHAVHLEEPQELAPAVRPFINAHA
jgi:2-succinyl-6-hydroxy-2,4-cyclohexadiene-1-carboxylate synthase